MLFIFFLFAADIVDNPQTSGQIAALTLTADHVYGQDDGQIFSSNLTLAAAPDGHLFVLDIEGSVVYVYGPDGTLKRRIGKAGQGPGEFGMAVNLTLMPDGNLAIFDIRRQRVHRYTTDGKFLGEIALPNQIRGVPIQPVVLADGGMVLTTIQPGPQGETIYDLSLYNAKMVPVRSLARTQTPPVDWSKSNKPAFWVDFIKDQMELLARGLPMAVHAGDNTFMVCETKDYSGTLYDGKGKNVGGFTKSDQAEPLTEQSRDIMFSGLWDNFKASSIGQQLNRGIFDKALAAADLPAAVTPITAAFSTGDGYGILASYRYDKGEGHLDLYDANGHHTARGTFRGKAQYLAGTATHLYTVGPDADDNMVVTRHTLTRQ